MIKEFRLPGPRRRTDRIRNRQPGRSAVGDTVTLNQIIAEVETAKAVVELPSPFAGVITALHEQPGTVVEVGKPIVSFEVEDDAGDQPARCRCGRGSRSPRGSRTSWATAPSSKAPAVPLPRRHFAATRWLRARRNR